MELLRTRLCEWQPVGIDALALAPGGSEPRLAVGRANGAIELWDSSNYHLHISSPGQSSRSVRGFIWVMGNDATAKPRLISAGLHKEITEWDTATLEPIASIPSGGGAVWALCALEGRFFAACDDGTVRVFSLGEERGAIAYKNRLNVDPMRLLSVTAFGDDEIFAGGSNSCITKWSLATMSCSGKMQVEHSKDGEALIWSLVALGDHGVASGDSEGAIHILDPITCTVLQRLMQHQSDVLALATTLDGSVLLAGGVDAKISQFVWQPGMEERFVFWNAELSHTHDIRAIALDGGVGPVGQSRPYFSGGVSGKLVIHRVKFTGKEKAIRGRLAPSQGGRPLECSSFSPALQTASVAQSSRLLLCQRGGHLDLWYLQRPKGQGAPGRGTPALPESQLVLRISLAGSGPRGVSESGHLCASAISRDGRLLAASSASGSRLFHLNLEELEVHKEKCVPNEIHTTPARAMLFCSARLLALATWNTHQVLILDVPASQPTTATVTARFKEHSAAVSHLASAREWLASADVSGAVHVFNLDRSEHHARVPVGAAGGRLPTALGFSSERSHLFVVNSNHEIVIFDVEEKAIAANVASPVQIPTRVLAAHDRVCGISNAPGAPDKLFLWGHNSLLQLSWAKSKDETSSSTPVWRSYKDGNKEMRNILAMSILDEAEWGAPVLEPTNTLAASKKRKRSDSNEPAPKTAMVLTLEVSEAAVQKALPVAFDRKKYHKSVRMGSA